MTRYIYCRKCGEPRTGKEMCAEDRGRGFKIRYRYLMPHATPPEDHGVTITTDGFTQFSPMSELVCDQCSDPIGPNIAIACTIWNKREGECPPDWESEYGTLLPEQAVAVDDVLTETKPRKDRTT